MKRWLLLHLVLLATACGTNPVTGDREFNFVSESQELAIGAEQYQPARQSQGGQYKVDPGLTEYVNQVGQRVAAHSDRDLPYEFTVLNNSVPNAWALPGGKLAINRGLLVELDNEAELAAVLGHEVVHSAARHGAQSMERGMLLQGAMIAGAIAAQGTDYADYVIGGAQLGAQLINQSYGREAEREADRYGIEYMVEAGYNPEAAVSLQQTFLRLAEGREPGWLEGLFSSHPPSSERVRNNQEMVEELRAAGVTGGELGRDRYQQNLAFLRESQPAYDLFDQAQAMVQEDRLEEAMTSVDQALAMLPQEALFHGLKGDILVYQQRYRAAVEVYDEAIARDDEYFDYYLGRGVAYSRMNEPQQAQRDLEASVNLLPTAIAMDELGTLALQQNNREQAKQYFEAAAAAPGAAGERARERFARLDIMDNPQRYVEIQPYVTQTGRLGARVANRSPIAINQMVVEFQAAVGPRPATRAVTISRLEPGQGGEVDSGLSFPEGAQPAANQVSVRVRELRID